jgi:hypothetical protein
MNSEVSDLASANPSVSRKVANREYHARGACFKPYRLVQPADHIRTTRVHKPCWSSAVDGLGESAMKECILDIELVHGLRPREREPKRELSAL